MPVHPGRAARPFKRAKREAGFKVRLTREERRRLEGLAHAEGLTLSELARRRLGLGTPGGRVRQPPRVRRLPPEVREALLPLARLGINLSQLAHWENARRQPAEAMTVVGAVREVSEHLAALRRQLLDLSGLAHPEEEE